MKSPAITLINSLNMNIISAINAIAIINPTIINIIASTSIVQNCFYLLIDKIKIYITLYTYILKFATTAITIKE